MSTRMVCLSALVMVSASACSITSYPPQAQLENVVIPVRDTTPKPKGPPPKEAPPDSGPAKDYRFPKTVWSELPTGLRFASIPIKALPLVQIRVVVLGGKAADGER